MRNDQQVLELEKKKMKRKWSTMEMKIELTSQRRFKSCFEGGAAEQWKKRFQTNCFLFFWDNYNILKHDRGRVSGEKMSLNKNFFLLRDLCFSLVNLRCFWESEKMISQPTKNGWRLKAKKNASNVLGISITYVMASWTILDCFNLSWAKRVKHD